MPLMFVSRDGANNARGEQDVLQIIDERERGIAILHIVC